MTKTSKKAPAEAARTKILKLLKSAGPMVRMPHRFITNRLGIDAATYSAALDQIVAEGKTKIMRTGGQGGFVALA